MYVQLFFLLLRAMILKNTSVIDPQLSRPAPAIPVLQNSIFLKVLGDKYWALCIFLCDNYYCEDCEVCSGRGGYWGTLGYDRLDGSYHVIGGPVHLSVCMGGRYYCSARREISLLP